MAKKKSAAEDKFSPEYVRKHRTFPAFKTFLLVLCILAQITLVCMAIFAEAPAPQDKIDSYTVTVEPKENGSLDITYEFVWTALDEEEPLTWVEIGIANSNFELYTNSVQGGTATRDVYDGYCYVRVDFPIAYTAGDKVQFSFKINQRDLLHGEGKERYFYFVPGWFNATPVEQYTFRWKDSFDVVSSNTQSNGLGWLTWQGSLECGEYVPMEVYYREGAFSSAETMEYDPFDDSEAYNELQGSLWALRIITVLGALLLIIAEVYIVDSYVSYGRGRGFIRSGGYHVHHYGRVNPRYRAYRDTQNNRGGGSGRGCACACACACAGGGRAGCSRKEPSRK